MPRLATVAVITVVLSLVPATGAAAAVEDPEYLGWSTWLPPTSTTFTPTSEPDCVAGRNTCVDKVIREMERRLAPLARSCDHDAPFALGYLRTTEEYRRAMLEPGFFEDPAFVNHEDVVFAAYYADAYDAWHGGAAHRTPPAWRVAFRAADDRMLPASGNFMLGINAHIQRDLPFVLAGIGLVKPDGTTRKTDHDRVNRFLNRVADDFIPELARRFDPTADDRDLPGPLDDVLTFQIIPTWREVAWRNAERLAAAPGPAARALVAAQIEAYAHSQAVLLRDAMAYGPLKDSRARDAHCATVGG